MSTEGQYPRPFWIRLFGPTERSVIWRPVLLFGFLLLVGLVFDRLLSLEKQFDHSTLYLLIYSVVVAFGIWALSHIYWQTKQTLEETTLVSQVTPCLRKVYSSRPMIFCGLLFAILVGLLQAALRFKVPFSISVYFFIWNILVGFVAGLGLWAALGSDRLSHAISKSKMRIFLLAPSHTPDVRALSQLFWNYNLLFTFEVLLFSVAVTLAGTTLNTLAQPFFASRFTAFDIAGALSFFFIALFCPLYAIVLQWRILAAVRRTKAAALAELDHDFKQAVKNATDKERVSGLLSANEAITKSRELPFRADNLTKFLTMLVPGLAYLYGKNSDVIQQFGRAVLKAFLPSVGT